MSNAIPARRWRLLPLLAGATALALGSFWLNQLMQRKLEESLPAAPRSTPDYYVEKFSLAKMSSSGQARYIISGALLTHHPQDDSHFIEQPVLHSLDSTRAPMVLRANRAKVEDNNSKVHMLGDVSVDRPASAGAQSFHLDTQYLLVLPDENIMQSKLPVTLRLGLSTVTGVGMIANQATRQLQVLHQARVTYHTPARAAVSAPVPASTPAPAAVQPPAPVAPP